MPEGKGIVDDLFIHELCLALHKTRKELGEQMTAHELTVQWPAYYGVLAREREREERKEEERRRSRRFKS